MFKDALGAANRAFADVQKVGSLGLCSNRQICRLLGYAVATMRKRRNPCRHHTALAFVQMAPMQVQADDELQWIGAAVRLKSASCASLS
jgi:hypothetical protein